MINSEFGVQLGRSAATLKEATSLRKWHERPLLIGLALSALIVIISVGITIFITARSIAFQAARIADEQRAINAQITAAKNLANDETLARKILPSLKPLCSDIPPVVQSFVLSQQPWPGLKMTAQQAPTGLPSQDRSGVSNEPTGNVPSTLTAGADTVTAIGDQRSLLSFVIAHDLDSSLRQTVVLQTIQRTQNGSDAKGPAATDLVSASLLVRSFALDPTICDKVSDLASASFTRRPQASMATPLSRALSKALPKGGKI